MDRQCSSCGGFCKKSGCERENIKPKTEKKIYQSWGIPKEIAPQQGLMHVNDFLTISELQTWFEEVNPHYIQCYKSIFDQLDLTKITNFIDWKGTGEKGGTCYSSEECGVIALQCPDNPENYHVMENQFVEVDLYNFQKILFSY